MLLLVFLSVEDNSSCYSTPRPPGSHLRIIRITLLRHFVAVRFLDWLCFFLDGFSIFTATPSPRLKKRATLRRLSEAPYNRANVYRLNFSLLSQPLPFFFAAFRWCPYLPRLYYFNRIGIGNGVNLIYFTRRKPTENRLTPPASCR